MKYKVLLIGRNKVIMEDFFQYLADDFEMQTSSMRHLDITSHIQYYNPDAVIYCMNREERERMDVVTSLREILFNAGTTLVLTGNLDECEEFQRVSGGMGNLVLKKPITARTLKDHVVQYLDDKKAAKEAEEAARLAAEKEAAEEAEAARIAAAIGAQSAIDAVITEAANLKQQQSASSDNKKHILVIDDDPMMLKLIKEQLKENYSVATAISGAIGRKFLENKKTDMIILDYEMPNETGAEVLEKIRKNPATAKLPVVFLTGIKDREKIRKVVELKPQGYLLKPIESEQLIKTIKHLIG